MDGHSNVSQEYLAALLDGAFDAIISKDLDGIVRTWNPSAQRLFGWTADEIVGQPITLLFPPERLHEESVILDRIRSGQIVSRFETERRRKDGRVIPLAVTISPIRQPGGEIIGASKIAHDISAERALRDRLSDSDQRFRALADNIPQMAWMADSAGSIFWYNKRWFDYTGSTLPEMEGWGWTAVHHPDHVERVVERIQHSWDTGTPWEDTFPLRGADGRYRWFLSRALPIRDKDGEIRLWFGTNTDITEQRQNEEQIEFLLAEMNHRTKNLLTMIQAIVNRTLLPRNASFMSGFEGRLSAIGANLDLLTRRKWVGAPVRELIASQLSYFQDLIGDRITLAGDDSVLLRPSAAEAIGLAIHELATNAGKYGALSDDAGKLSIEWSVERGETDQFVLRWTEFGGPPVVPPTGSGFGSIVTRRNPQAALDAEVSVDYGEGGLVWVLKAPLDRIVLPAVS